jgi:hypothetical protein
VEISGSELMAADWICFQGINIFSSITAITLLMKKVWGQMPCWM